LDREKEKEWGEKAAISPIERRKCEKERWSEMNLLTLLG